VIISNRFLALLLATGLGCTQPTLENVGGKNGKGGDDGNGGGTSGKSGGNGSGGKSGTPLPPNVSYPDGGIPDGGPSNPLGEMNACAGMLYAAKRVPVDLLMLLDISGSMEESAGAQSKWTATHDALLTFVKDPMSAGLGVGMETFPPPSKKCNGDGDCGTGYCEEKGVCSLPAGVATTEAACNDNRIACTGLEDTCTKYGICAKSGLRCVGTCTGGDTCSPRPKFCVNVDAGCDATAYQTPIVPITELPGAVPMMESAMNNIVPQGTTPTTPAVTGALAHLRTRAMANPDRKQVLVLATDGLPTECGLRNSLPLAQAALETGSMGTPAIPTYVIGIFGSNQIARAEPALNGLATSGGTMTPFILTTGNDLNKRFLDAINQIRGATLGCEFTIPKPAMGGTLNYDQVNVQVNNPGGGFDRLGYVANMAACDPVRGGWYYDSDPKTTAPTHVLLCEASCKKTTMVGVSVDVKLGCKTEVIK
jgi:hypothetical protein